jgi:alkylation response protein AidB-like acyl-CoA dehydrogenase
MELTFSAELEAFRKVTRDWLESNLTGKFESLKGRGGPGDEHYAVDLRMDWNRVMGAAGWNCVGWPKSAGGRGVPLMEEVIFNEEYVRARRPGAHRSHRRDAARPTLIHFGSEAQKQKYLPGIVAMAKSSGARATANPTQAATSPVISDHRRAGGRASGSSKARRSGPASRRGPTTASCCAAPTRARRSTRASATCW